MTVFDPEVGDSIVLNDGIYSFAEHPNAPGIVHSQSGRFGVVYRILKGEDEYALKQFNLEMRKPELEARNIQISQLKGILGLRAINDREILLPNNSVASKHPDLSYSIKMPWIRGKVWSNYLEKGIALSALDCLNFARLLANITSALEKQGIAHCDLSSGNIVFEIDKSNQYQVQLIDIEDIYARNFTPPKYQLLGSPGYSPKWLSNYRYGAYCPEGDRFAGGILIAEILCWQFPDVRQKAYDGTSYFNPNEISTECDRYKLIKERLSDIDIRLPKLFVQVWSSKSLPTCPKLSEWKEVIDDIEFPSLAISPSLLDFGMIDVSSPTFSPPCRSLTLINTGNTLVTGEIKTESWISITSPSSISLNPGEKQTISVALKNTCPKTNTSEIGHTEKCMKLTTNGGSIDIFAFFTPGFAKLQVDKTKLNFGILDLTSYLPTSPKAKITLSNNGSGLLSVKINNKSKWVSVSKSFITLTKGQSIDIWITLSKEAPVPDKGKIYQFTDWIQITSNGGNQNIAGEYLVKIDKWPFWLSWLVINVIGFLLAFWGIDKFLNVTEVYTFAILESIVLGGVQSFILRKKIKNPANWFFATAFGFLAGFVINFWFGSLFSVFVDVLNIFLAGVTVGLLPGLMQWLALRKTFAKSSRIILSSSIGYGVGLLLAQFASGIFIPPIPMILLGISYSMFVGVTLDSILPRLPKRNEKFSFVHLNANSWSEFFKNLLLWALLGTVIGAVLGAVYGMMGYSIRAGGSWSVGALVNGGVDGLLIGLFISIIGSSNQSKKFPTREVILSSIGIGVVLVGLWPFVGVISSGFISLVLFGGCCIYIADAFMKKQVIDEVPTRPIFYFAVLLPVYGLGVTISVLVCLRGDPIHGALWIGLSGLALSLFTSATYLLSKK